MKKPQRRKRIVRRVPKDCIFCKQKSKPDYKETETLSHYVTERGKIIPRSASGICQKHQVMLSASIKQARFLALLPYIVRPA